MTGSDWLNCWLFSGRYKRQSLSLAWFRQIRRLQPRPEMRTCHVCMCIVVFYQYDWLDPAYTVFNTVIIVMLSRSPLVAGESWLVSIFFFVCLQLPTF